MFISFSTFYTIHTVYNTCNVYREIFAPCSFIFAPFTLVVSWQVETLGKLQCLKLSLFNQNFDWANSRQGETNSNWRAKITQYKNYPVYRMYIWHTFLSSELLNIQVGMPYQSFIYGSYKFLSDKYHTQWQFHFSLLPLS